MEIEESRVKAELSQVRDSYVWVTTIYSSPDQTCFVQHAPLNIVFDGFLS